MTPTGRLIRTHRRVGLLLVMLLMLATTSPAASPSAPDEPTFTIHATRDGGFESRPSGAVFILFIGTDARAGFEGERGDALHLVGVNPETGVATMLNLPRDLWVPMPGFGTKKITLAYLLGRDDLTARTVGQLVGVNISYVVSTDFAGFIGLVDDMGGVDVDVPLAMNDRLSGAVFEAGSRHMNGVQALAFSRNRMVPDGDLRRTEHQALLLLAALRKARAEAASPASSLRLIATMARRTRLTGGSWTDVYRLTRLALAIDPGTIRTVTVPSSIGFVGPEAVVFVRPEAEGLFADLRDDATLQNH
ncbi:MAG: LCP family protein [Acidimicrobiales bacterium]